MLDVLRTIHYQQQILLASDLTFLITATFMILKLVFVESASINIFLLIMFVNSVHLALLKLETNALPSLLDVLIIYQLAYVIFVNKDIGLIQ